MPEKLPAIRLRPLEKLLRVLGLLSLSLLILLGLGLLLSYGIALSPFVGSIGIYLVCCANPSDPAFYSTPISRRAPAPFSICPQPIQPTILSTATINQPSKFRIARSRFF